MGITGWKIDFLDRDDQAMVAFCEKAAATAARYHQFIDFHGTSKPAGLTRTWPNVLNYEAVNGLEQLKWAKKDYDQVTYDVILPFTRLVAGPADYTQGAMRNATKKNFKAVYSEGMSQGTRCRQLAEYVVFDAPFTMLCDSPSNYLNEPECTAFITSIPTVWDETVCLDGEIGQYVVMARRSGDTWYIGALTNWEERDITVQLPRSGPAILFRDGVNADRAARDYSREECVVRDSLTVHLAPGGGFVLQL
jgi:alpha-glucosidase